MPNRNESYIENLLNLMNNRVHRRSEQHRVFGENVGRVLSEVSDDTGIGQNNDANNLRGYFIRDRYLNQELNSVANLSIS